MESYILNMFPMVNLANDGGEGSIPIQTCFYEYLSPLKVVLQLLSCFYDCTPNSKQKNWKTSTVQEIESGPPKWNSEGTTLHLPYVGTVIARIDRPGLI